MRTDHFSSKHYWNGYEINCVCDEEMALKRKNNNVNDISWDNNIRSMVIYTSLSDFPNGEEPEPNTHIYFDRKPMKVLEVDNNMGVLGIHLTALEPREL